MEAKIINYFKNKKILITGANGFIGSKLFKKLSGFGAEVIGFGLDSTNNSSPTEKVDLRDLEALKSQISSINPSLVFHLGAMVTGNPEIDLVLPMMQNNLEGTVNLLLSLYNSKVERIIIVGSAEESIGGIPTSPYSASKTASYLYSRMFQTLYSLPIVYARLVMVYGPGQDESKLIPHIINKFLEGKPPHINSGNRIIDLVYIDDVIKGIILTGCVSGIEGEEFEFGIGKGYKIDEIVDMIAKKIVKQNPIMSTHTNNRKDEKNLIANPQKANELLNWTTEWNLEKGLETTIEWYQRKFEEITHDKRS